MSGEMTAEDETEKRMRLRYAGVCRMCGAELPARTPAVYEKLTKTVRCVTCDSAASTAPTPVPEEPEAAATTGRTAPDGDPAPPPLDTPGASARREYERRRAKDEQRIRDKWGRLGGIAVALSDERQSTSAWVRGANGEERLGAQLNSFVSDDVAVLHDRRIPGSSATIDHIVVTRAGIWVIGAKRYKGRPGLRLEGGFIRAKTTKLMVGSRDCTKLIDGALKQVGLIRDLVGDVPVTGALCFIEADWPLIGGAFEVSGVHVLWPRKLYKLMLEAAGCGAVDVAAVRKQIADRFKPA